MAGKKVGVKKKNPFAESDKSKGQAPPKKGSKGGSMPKGKMSTKSNPNAGGLY